jgi:Lrp/AsnC family transcriptional regulator, leucine-responsive regulatory protein
MTCRPQKVATEYTANFVESCENLGMNKMDREILKILQTDGRRSFTDIGAEVHLSANAVADRVRKLTQAGVIRGVRAIVDPATLGLTMEAQMDVKLRPTTSAHDFASALRQLPQVLSANLLTGSFDYSLSVVCADRTDLAAVTEFIRDKAGAQETYSRIVLRSIHLGEPEPRDEAAAPPAAAGVRAKRPQRGAAGRRRT